MLDVLVAEPSLQRPGVVAGIGQRIAATVAHDELYPDFGHPEGIGAQPWFTIRDDKLYPAFGHPQGIGVQAWYRIG